MLVSRLWRRGLSRSWFQKSRFFSHEETNHSVFPSISSQFFAGRNLGLGRTGHGCLLSMTLLREGLFSERGSGSCCIIPVCACLCSAHSSYCTSKARIVEGNVGSFALQQDNDISDWEGQIKPYIKIHEISGRMRKAAHSCDDSVLLCNVAIGDGGAKDAQNPSPFQFDNVMGECCTFDGLENSDKEDGGENTLLGLTMASKDNDVFTPPDNKTSKAICKLLNSKGWTASTKEILEKQYSLQLPHAVISTVILKQKNVAVASSFFQWACEHMGHNIRIYHAYLVRLGETKHFDEMWDLLTKMTENGLEASGRTFCMMIKACAVAGEPAMAVDVFKRAHEYRIVSDIRLHQALLTMFFESNLVEEARLFFSFMVQEGVVFDTHMYNTLIDGFNLFSATEDAKSSFDTMLKEGLEPNILTYNGLIEAYGNVNAIEKAMSAFSDLQRMGLKPTASTVNALLTAYCKVGRFDDAINLFASMNTFCSPNQSTFNILLHGLFSATELSKAITFFLFMEKEGLANRLTYIYLSNGLREAQQTEKVWQLCKDLFATHGYGIKEVCIALLNNLCCTGELNEAESLFEGLLESTRKPYVPSFAIMISLYCRLEMLDRAFELLSDLKGRGRRPSVFCYTPIIAALLKTNRVADALKCFQEMLEQKHEVTAVTCDFLLRELCKHGMVEDAIHVLNTILSKNLCIHKRTLTELMKCLCKVGKIEEANSYFRALFKLGRLPLKREAALQALSVMDVMSHSSNEEDRISF